MDLNPGGMVGYVKSQLLMSVTPNLELFHNPNIMLSTLSNQHFNHTGGIPKIHITSR